MRTPIFTPMEELYYYGNYKKKKKKIYADMHIPNCNWAQGPAFIKSDPDINLLELWPVLVSVWRWGRRWIGCNIRLNPIIHRWFER